MASVVIGETGYTLARERFRYSFSSGPITVQVWEGPEAAYETKIAELLATDGVRSVDGERKGSVCRITAEISAAPDGVTWDDNEKAEAEAEWRLVPYQVQTDIATHGAFLQNANGDSPQALQEIAADVRAGIATEDYDLVADVGDNSEYNAYRDLISIGTRDFILFGYVLRKSVALTDDQDAGDIIQFDQARAGQVVGWADATAAMPESAGIQQPSAWLFIGDGMNINPGAIVAGGNNEWSEVLFDDWLVEPPHIGYRQIGRSRKRLIEQSWIGAVGWSATLYYNGLGVP